MSSVTIGILAHVDAGKTTCIESMLYKSKTIRKIGRVDHQDAYLDYDEQERSRGITIYSKQAGLIWKDTHIDIIDTPGHADFSSEMERALSVLDLAVVVISGLDGVQSHTKTIWRCLEHYQIPALLFVNKMDIAHLSKEELLEDIRKNLTDQIADVQADDVLEQYATFSDALLEEYMETESISEASLQQAIWNREGFPVLFGSALKSMGMEQLLDALIRFAPKKDYPSEFGARVFKVTADEKGSPLVHMKITGGLLKTKDVIDEQKADQIRIYSGQGYQAVPQAEAGMVCTVKGFENLKPGAGLGFEPDLSAPVLEACLLYKMLLPAEADPVMMMGHMRALMLEDPSLETEFDEESHSIMVHLMGDIQMDVLQKRIADRTGFQVGFGPGRIVYKETIADAVFGYGHFEPLRHYAEVHLLLEPLKRGSGLVFSSRVSRDILSLNWQRLVITHLQEKEHRGVLMGAPITDMKITLVNGRAHNKHTEGGDFRQATYRALRQGLKKASSILLEPYYRFTITLDSQHLSRLLFDLESRKAAVEVETLSDGSLKIQGRGPVRTMLNYQSELSAITRGTGQIVLESDGYDECMDASEIIAERGYDSELDRFNPTGSVFCSHGSGLYVPWNEVEEMLHIPIDTERSSSWSVNSGKVSQQELNRIASQAGGRNRNEKKRAAVKPAKKKKDLDLSEHMEITPQASLPVCLVVDGYNMIYSWPELKELARSSLHAARERLIDLVVNYQGYKGWSLILVFDGWKRKDNSGSSKRWGSSTIVYTPTGVSADAYIEKKVHDLKGKFRCIAVTSDALIQNSILASGASRMSARELEKRVCSVNQAAMAHLQK